MEAKITITQNYSGKFEANIDRAELSRFNISGLIDRNQVARKVNDTASYLRSLGHSVTIEEH